MLMRPQRMALVSCALILAIALPDLAFASTGALGGGMPFDSTIQKFVDWMSGPLVKYGLTIALAVLGITFMLDEERLPKWLGRGVRLIIGAVVASGAAGGWAASLFGISSGALLP